MEVIAELFVAYIDWIASVLSLTAVVLTAQKSIWCWPIFMLGNVGFIIHSLPRGDWAYVTLFSIYFLFNIYGWRRWAKDSKQEAL